MSPQNSDVETQSPTYWYWEVEPLGGEQVLRVMPSRMGLVSSHETPRGSSPPRPLASLGFTSLLLLTKQETTNSTCVLFLTLSSRSRFSDPLLRLNHEGM